MFFITRNAVITRPIIAKSPLPSVTDPSLTNVESSFITSSAFCSPTNVMNNPIPMVMDFFIVSGMALTIASLSLVTVRRSKIIPSIRMAVNANCQEYPIPRQIVKTKNALGPMPGAMPNGIFATNATKSVLMIATNAVVVNTAL